MKNSPRLALGKVCFRKKCLFVAENQQPEKMIFGNFIKSR